MLHAFSGTQNVSNQHKEEAWRVNVQIQGIDLEHGYLCGTMEALNVPMADTPVRPYTLTYFSSSCLNTYFLEDLKLMIFYRE
ncbi:putative vacuolar import/degradation protein Vid24 [Arabidopsis thaliana]